MKLLRTLILEDDLETLSKIFGVLTKLEERLKIEFAPIVISESPHVDQFINNNESLSFDLILLDRDCKAGGSFHNLNIDKFGAKNIIAISSVPDYNEQVRQKGVTRIVHKDYRRLDNFGERLLKEIETLLTGSR